MNKKIIIIALALAAVSAWAQEKQSKIGYVAMSNIDNYITIDTATVRVWYALNALDIKDESTYIDWQILEVGSHCNKYYSYFVWESTRCALLTAGLTAQAISPRNCCRVGATDLATGTSCNTMCL